MKILSEDLNKLELLCIADMNVKWYCLYGRVWWFLKKLNIELPYNTPKLTESRDSDNLYANAHCWITIISKMWKQSINRWVDKENKVHTYNEMLCKLKKE